MKAYEETSIISDENFQINLVGFERFLKEKKTEHGAYRCERTIALYVESMRLFIRLTEDDVFSQRNISEAVENAKEELSANTVNKLINAINLYCDYIGKNEWQTSNVKIQRKQFLDDVISLPDYEFLLKKAIACKKWNIYLYARIAGTTGMRVSEMLQIKREHIEHGYVDLYGKGAKQRRIYFPSTMRKDVLEVLDNLNIKSGFVISAWGTGENITKSGIQHALEKFGEQCEFPKGLLHTHGFRHFFAKEFIKKYQNIALLADLLGHSNLETTRIYLKYTSKEQSEIVDQVVTW